MDDVLLLTLLNSTPMVDGVRTDTLELETDDPELLRAGRDVLQDVVRGTRPASDLQPFLLDVIARPSIGEGRLTWSVEASRTRTLLLRAVEAWDELERSRPGRLRACANDECARFLLDRSKSNSARWCSMSSCGNRLKARRHYQRKTSTQP